MAIRVKTACIAAFFLFLVLFCGLIRETPVFEGGEGYEFYRGASSSAEIVPSTFPALDKLLLFPVRGESARFAGDRYSELKQKFHAELLFTEQAGGVTNYYLYSPELGECVLLFGKPVNLHIAVGEGRTAVGTPLIFGGA